jgi:hypothetical protein
MLKNGKLMALHSEFQQKMDDYNPVFGAIQQGTVNMQLFR